MLGVATRTARVAHAHWTGAAAVRERRGHWEGNMIRRDTKSGQLRITFVLPQEEPVGRVSVVGDFNDWKPGAHTLVRRSNGTRSVSVKLAPGSTYRFRYLGEGGRWFDEPDADARDADNCVLNA